MAEEESKSISLVEEEDVSRADDRFGNESGIASSSSMGGGGGGEEGEDVGNESVVSLTSQGGGGGGGGDEVMAVAPAEVVLAARAAVQRADTPVSVVEEEVVVEEVEVIPTVRLVIRPRDKGWVMGDDWMLDVPNDKTIPEVKAMIEEQRGISRHRILARMGDGKYQHPNKEKLSIRRLGINDGYELTIEPTLQGAWLWHTYEWYEQKLIREILAEIDTREGARVSVKQLVEECVKTGKIDFPPCIAKKHSLQVFVRKFPEFLHMHVDVSLGHYWVSRPKTYFQLPSLGQVPVEMGLLEHFKPKAFPWEEYAEIDDTKRVELDFEIPDVNYSVSVLCANGIMRADTFGSSDPMGIVTFDNGVERKEVGRTKPKRNTLNPEWRDARFDVYINASYEVEKCTLLVELWDVDVDDQGNDVLGDFLGSITLTGRALVELIADGKTAEQTYNLEQRPESGPPDADQSGICGTITLKGGKNGYEVYIISGKGLVDLPNKFSKVFLVVCWNGDELVITLPDTTSAKDPLWKELVMLPPVSITSSLDQCVLEIQVWGTVGRGNGPDEDARGDFMGSVILKEQDLVDFLTGSAPWATSLRKKIGPSKNVPIKMRKKPFGGYMCIMGGPVGLPVQPGKKVELTIVHCDRLAKLFKVYVKVEWNFVAVAETPHERVEFGKSIFKHKVVVESDAGSADCFGSTLRLDLWESLEGSLGSAEAQYLGMVFIEKEQLVALVDQKFAQYQEIFWEPDPTLDSKRQRMIRGNLFIRGSIPQGRAENERIIIVKAARNLAKANFGAMFGLGSSDPFVEITFNGQLIGTTKVIEASLQPVWDEENFFIEIPPIRELTEKELKVWLRNAEALRARGEQPQERSMYFEFLLQIAVYDEKDGGKGSCLGVVRFDEAALLDFFESYEPREVWFPLVKDVRKENKDLATKNALIGEKAEIMLATPGHRFDSPIQWRVQMEKEMLAERERIAQEKADAEAAELARQEREYQAELERQAEEEAARIRAERIRIAEEAAAEKAERDRLLAIQEAEDAAKAATVEKANEAFAILQEREEDGLGEDDLDDLEDDSPKALKKKAAKAAAAAEAEAAAASAGGGEGVPPV